MVTINTDLQQNVKTSVTHRAGKSESAALRLIDYDESILDLIYHHLVAPFFSPNDRDSCEAIRSYLRANKANSKNRIQYYVAAAVKNRVPIGASIFGFFGWEDFCLMSGHYTAVVPQERGKHLTTRLDAFRQWVAVKAAKDFGYEGLDSSVITIPASNSYHAQAGPSDDVSRVRSLWRHLGYQEVDFPFVQLPLADGKQPSPQSLWIRRYNRHDGPQDCLPKDQLEKILEACNYFRDSERRTNSYSEYRCMMELMHNMTEIKILND